MYLKNLENPSIQGLVFFQLVGKNLTFNGTSNPNSSSSEPIESLLKGQKAIIDFFGKDGPTLASFLEFCSDDLSKANKSLQTLPTDLTNNPKCEPIIAHLEKTIATEVDQKNLDSQIAASMQNLINRTYQTVLDEMPQLTEQLKNAMVENDKSLTSTEACTKKIETVKGKLQLENPVSEHLIENLEFIKKLISTIERFHNTIQNYSNPLLIFPREILVAIITHLPVHDIVKINTLCLLSHGIFQESKEAIFNQILTRDFPYDVSPKTSQVTYFSFYKKVFLGDCYLSITFDNNRSSKPKLLNHKSVFEDNFLDLFRTEFSKDVFLLPSLEKLKMNANFRSIKGAKYFGYFIIALPFETAKKYLNEKKYEQLLSKVTYFDSEDFVKYFFTPPRTNGAVVYDTDTKKFKMIEPSITHSQSSVTTDEFLPPEANCSLM